jgi:hypothetical protein
MNSHDFLAKVKGDGAASFWLQRQMQAVTDRDVLDALIDAEALAVYCELRAVEAGLKLTVREWCPRCEQRVRTIDDGETCAQCHLVL